MTTPPDKCPYDVKHKQIQSELPNDRGDSPMSGIRAPRLLLVYIHSLPPIGHAQEGDRRDRVANPADCNQFPTVICEWKPSLPEPYANLSIRTAVCHDSICLDFSTQSQPFSSSSSITGPATHGPHVHLPNICPNPRFSSQWPRILPSLGWARQAPFRTFSSTTRLAARISLWCRAQSLDVISSADFSATTLSSASRMLHAFVAVMGDGTREQVVVTGNLRFLFS